MEVGNSLAVPGESCSRRLSPVKSHVSHQDGGLGSITGTELSQALSALADLHAKPHSAVHRRGKKDNELAMHKVGVKWHIEAYFSYKVSTNCLKYF